ncbi:MAG: TolC family protein [Sphingomonadales bacterium]|nr:TolC family protein [Sphingomonadales bacterium]
MHNMIAVCAVAFLCGLVFQARAQDGGTVLTMEEAVARALDAAPSLSAGDEAVRAASGALRQARLRPNPTLSLQAENVVGSGAFSAFDRAEFTLGIDQRIERGGKRGARVGLAEADRQLARLEAVLTRLDVSFEARRAYVEAMAVAAVLDTAERRAGIAAELQETVRRRVRSARDSVAAEQRVLARALEAEADVEQARHALGLAKQNLAALWGGAGDGFAIDRPRFFDVPAADEAAVRDRLDNAPDLLMARHAVDRAAAALTLERARAKQDPTVGLGLRRLEATNDVAAMVSVSLPLALFDVNRGNIDRAAAERRRAQWQTSDARLRLERAVAAHLATLGAAGAEAAALRDRILPTALKALDETRAGYGRGAFTYLEVLAAQTALQDLRAREIAALQRSHLAKAALDRLLATSDDAVSGEETSR